MKQKTDQIHGVLHQTLSATNYQLRRYEPSAELSALIEQFWFVDWHLQKGQVHTQQNLPDPNCHLILDKGQLSVITPVSKVYKYTMSGTGWIIGVKFKAGALVHLFDEQAEHLVDKSLNASECFSWDSQEIVSQLNTLESDQAVIGLLEAKLRAFVPDNASSLNKLNALLSQIQQNTDINSVEDLSDCTSTSVRTIQRLFKQFIGLTPKWLIRKYRLTQALQHLEKGDINLSELAAKLDYADQSHLTKDFNSILGYSPSTYQKVRP